MIRATATEWLDDAGPHLEAATEIAELDPSGDYVLADDAARKSVAGALLMSGHKVLSRPGPRQALAQYAHALAVQVDEPVLTPSIDSYSTETDPSTDREPSGRPKSKRPSTRQERFAGMPLAHL